MNEESKLEKMRIVIETARPEDARALGRLKYDNLVHRAENKRIRLSDDLSVEKEQNLSDTAVNKLAAILEQSTDDDYYLTAKRGTEIVGMCRMTWRPDDNRYQFRQFYVHPRLQGMKIGTKIFTAAAERARNSVHAPKGIWLETGDFNVEAQRMYEGWGFKFTGESTHDGQEGSPTWVRMELDFA